jgi:hypothetical protein
VGTVVGAAVGAIVGGLAGKGVAESIDPTAEDAYWRDNYASRPYAGSGLSFDEYRPAYALGVGAFATHHERSFDDVEGTLENDWDRSRGTSTLHWAAARPAAKDAWDRLAQPTERSGYRD